MSIDRILDAIKAVQDLVEDEKEHLKNGEYLDLCNSMQAVYNCARAIKKAESSNNDDDTSDEDDEDEGDEGEEEEVQIVHTPRGPYYVSADGSMRRVVYPEVVSGGRTRRRTRTRTRRSPWSGPRPTWGSTSCRSCGNVILTMAPIVP